MSRRRPAPATYLQRLLAELEEVLSTYVEVLTASEVHNIDPNRGGGSGIAWIGYPTWGWGPSDDALEVARMALLQRVRDWTPRYRLLFPHPTPTIARRLDEGTDHLERWLLRSEEDYSVPSSNAAAVAAIEATVADLRHLAGLLPADEHPVRAVPDTNTLIDNPDLAAYTDALGPRYMTHVLPVVLRELDDLKRAGRTPELREAARKADRRLKAHRDNGDVRTGARVAGDVHVVFEHIEPRDDRLPSWLDLDVPDDRFVAASLLLQSKHPGSAVHVVTSDLNLQNKLAAAALPFTELP